jgi:hypothetical protein
MPGWVPDWLLVLAPFGLWALLYFLVSTAVLYYLVSASRLFWKTAVMAAKHQQLPSFIVQFLAVFIVGVVGYLYLRYTFRSTPVMVISGADVVAGVGVASGLVGWFLRATQRELKSADIIADISARAVFDDGPCTWCGFVVDGKRVSHTEYQKLWEDRDGRYRIRGHMCESCNSLSCLGCRKAAVGFLAARRSGNYNSRRDLPVSSRHTEFRKSDTRSFA